MIGMEVVRSTLNDDVAILSRSFYIGGYVIGFMSSYVSLEHEDGHTQCVDDNIKITWDDIWREKNN
jgi:hypothetical protein